MFARLWIIVFLVSLVLSAVRMVRRARSARMYGQGQDPWGGRQASGSTGRTKARSPYDVLGVAPTATETEVTAAYRKLVHMYHPDKVAELAPEFREVAEQRMKEINAAYEDLKRGRST